MFVFAWSLLSSYTESVRRRRLHTALTAFFTNPNSYHKMIVCRPAAHRLTRLLGVGFSSWGAETTNGSLARVASEPFLTRRSSSDGDMDIFPSISTPIYRSELMEVVAMPDESISSSDWRFLSTSSHFAPSSSSVFFIVATPPKVRCPSSIEDGSRPSTSTTDSSSIMEEEERNESEMILESSCVRVGWNRVRPNETLYACDADTFTSIVFAWTNGLLRSSLKRREPVVKLRTVWINPVHNNNGQYMNGIMGSLSPPTQSSSTTTSSVISDGDITPRALSPPSRADTEGYGIRLHGSHEEIIPSTSPRPLLEQLFLGDGQGGATSFGSLLSSALKTKLGSDGALNLVGNATLPRRGFTRRAQFAIGGSSAALPPLPYPSQHTSASLRSLRSSRSSLRYRQQSPLAIDLPRFTIGHLRERPKSFSARGDHQLTQQPEIVSPRSPTLITVAPTVAHPPARPVEKCTSNDKSNGSEEETLDWRTVCEDTIESIRVASLRSQENRPIDNHVSPSITISSDLDDVHSLAEGRLDYSLASTSEAEGGSTVSLTAEGEEEDTVDQIQSISSIVEEEEENMPLDVMRAPSSPKNIIGKRQVTTPQSKKSESSSSYSARLPRRSAAASPMIEMLRGVSKSECGTGRSDVPVDPQLQKLTTIELLQRRRHSTMMYPFEESALFAVDGSRRRSLSPMALSMSLQNASFGSSTSTLGAESILRGGPFDTRRRSQSRRIHSASRDRGGGARKPAMKPPSVLVYTAGQSSVYDRIHSSLLTLLPPHVYTIFNISPEAIRRPHWVDTSSACMILADTHELDDAAWKQLQEYFNKSGKIIFVCQNSLLASISSCESIKKQTSMLRMAFGDKSQGSMSKDLESFLKKTLKSLAKNGEVHERYQSKDIVGGLKYSVVLSKKQDQPLLLYMENGGTHNASAVFSDATTEQLVAPGSRLVADALQRIGLKIEENVKAPSLSIGYLIADEEFLTTCKCLRYGVEIGTTPHIFMRRQDLIAENPLPLPRPDLLPVQVLSSEDAHKSCSFDSRRYFATLKHRLGRTVLFVPVTTTTMDVSKSMSEALPGYDGIVVVAGQQIKGQGRGGNEFISPLGVAMFTFSYSLPSSAALSKSPSFIQHVAAVAMAAGVHELSGMDDFPLRIKWPNDFYFNRSHKIGGLLVSARARDDALEFTVGMGMNVSNALPTTCLNDMLPDNAPESANFSVEEVIAATLNKFEYFVNVFENQGQNALLEHYYKYWLHSREEVTIGDENEKVVIRGLDKFGFLEVRSKKHPNKLYSVADDGNTFDMMKGLIRLKLK